MRVIGVMRLPSLIPDLLMETAAKGLTVGESSTVWMRWTKAPFRVLVKSTHTEWQAI